MAIQPDSSLNAATLTTAFVSIGLASFVWWRRFVRLSQLRERVARIHSLSEEILGAVSAARIAELLDRRLSEILSPCHSAIFSLDSARDELEAVAGSATVPAAAAECQRSGNLGMSDATLYLPMFAQGKPAGVLALRSLTGASLQNDELGALRHMANQAAIAIRILDQRHLRDQLLRSEQLGAAGVLVTNIASELRPLLTRVLTEAAQHNLTPVTLDASAALDTLDRLISIGRPEQARVQPFDLNNAVGQLAEFRSRTWRLQMIESSVELSPATLTVLGARGHIEQAVLNVLVLAEQTLASSQQKHIRMETLRREGKAVLSIIFPAPGALDPGASLAAPRSLIEGQGGEWLQQTRGPEACFEIALPLAASPAPSTQPVAQPTASRPLTLLLAHPTPDTLRTLITALGERGHRAVPTDTAGHALDLVSRLPFDALFATRSLTDLDWPNLATRAQESVGAIGLICASAEIAPAGIHALHVPVDELELDRLLAELAATL